MEITHVKPEKRPHERPKDRILTSKERGGNK
jgi:hypothetical protein